MALILYFFIKILVLGLKSAHSIRITVAHVQNFNNNNYKNNENNNNNNNSYKNNNKNNIYRLIQYVLRELTKIPAKTWIQYT